MNTNKEAPQTLLHKKVKQHKHRTHTTQTRRSKQHRERKAPQSSECTDTTHQNNINKTRLTSSVQRRNVCDVSLQSQQNTKLDNFTTFPTGAQTGAGGDSGVLHLLVSAAATHGPRNLLHRSPAHQVGLGFLFFLCILEHNFCFQLYAHQVE